MILKMRLFLLTIPMAVLAACAAPGGSSSGKIVYSPPRLYEAKGEFECPERMRFPAKEQSPEALQGEEPRVLFRCPPLYPKKCMMRSDATDTVDLIFDVLPSGIPTAARVMATTNPCLNDAAVAATLKWRFVESERTWSDIPTTITLILE